MADLDGTNYSETDANNNNAAPLGMPEGMAPSGVNDAWRAGMGATKRAFDRDHAGTWCTVAGTANAITLTYAAAPSAYVQGQKFAFKAAAANTGPATVNVNGLGAKNIFVIANGTPTQLNGNEIAAGGVHEIEYDGTQFQLLDPAPDEGSWTPTLVGSATAGAYGYTTQLGRYVRRGNWVTVWFTVAIASGTPGTGNAQINTLPFTSSALGGLNVSGAVGYFSGLTLDAGYQTIGIFAAASSGALAVYESGSGQTTQPLPVTKFGAGSAFSGTLTYRIN